MTNSTQTFWEVDGVSLQTYAQNIVTWGGEKQAPPPLRGEDVLIPYRPGRTWVHKEADSRTLPLEMWVLGANDDGTVPTGPRNIEFQANLRALRNLLWNPKRQIKLTKRWMNPGSPTVYKASALASFAGGFVPSMNGSARATFTVDLLLADPYFYGDEITHTFNAGSSTQAQTLNILGDDSTTAVKVQFYGDRTNPRLSNSINGEYVELQEQIASGSVLVDVDAFTAKSGSTNHIRYVRSAVTDSKFWMTLEPGSQTVTLSGSTGTGNATLKYRPRWL